MRVRAGPRVSSAFGGVVELMCLDWVCRHRLLHGRNYFLDGKVFALSKTVLGVFVLYLALSYD